MSTEILRPTAHVIDSGLVSNPSNAYDGSTATVALLQGLPGAEASITLYNFPAGSIDPSGRTYVTLWVAGGWKSVNPANYVHVAFRAQVTDSWTLLDSDNAGGSGWPNNGEPVTYRSFDITALAAAYGAEGFQVLVVEYAS